MEACKNIVIDLEFTPTPKSVRQRGLAFEIIEIGAVELDAQGNEVSTFSSFVAPSLAKGVSFGVHRLTGIRDYDVCRAQPLENVLSDLSTWIGNGRIRLVTWSECDKFQIEKELAFKHLDNPFRRVRWLDLQKIYPQMMEVSGKSPMALSVAANWYGDSMISTDAHRALYDAQATARLMAQLLDGSYQEQKKKLQAAMRDPNSKASLASSIGGSRCEGLAELLATMTIRTTSTTA